MNPQSSDPHSSETGFTPGATTVDATEIAKFTAMAEAWWDPTGDFKPLHRFNPTRIAYIRDVAAAHFGRDAQAELPFDGLSLLEVGCGGGLLTEPMRRLGAEVTGIDPAPRNIGVARTHAEKSGLKITYLPCAAEDLLESGNRYDIVLAMEVIEHVADVNVFIRNCSKLVNPGGLMFLATLNRTAKAFALAIVGAEYVLRWLPRGTHDWRKFVKPSELAGALRRSGMGIAQMTGVSFNPLTDKWSLTRDLDVNYMLAAKHA
ncbi:MAG TPA: bifunctional 2-polyprenyl-6-hydroxyphenol methylase/3-demethylubiquinol 3-O-methyltransferase UbiG [Dongiaceae bacterium]|nr:bifunctional 2-polyprenyl-6-hydroxyphenol methylase/3-demethylubiquinol 3-O-methyltransferase UbiG [Dongiaceae bacterium]